MLEVAGRGVPRHIPAPRSSRRERDIIDAHGRVLVRGRGLGRLRGETSGAAALRRSIRAGGNLFGEPMCVMLRRETLESVGWWDDREPFYIDLGTYAHALVRGTLVAVPEALAGFRVSQHAVERAAHRRAEPAGRGVPRPRARGAAGAAVADRRRARGRAWPSSRRCVAGSPTPGSAAG